MKRVLPLFLLSLVLAGCVMPDLGNVQISVNYTPTNASNQTVNATPMPVPQTLSLCVFGLSTLEDSALLTNLTCRGENVEMELKTLTNTARAEEFSTCELFFLKDDLEGRYLDRALRMWLKEGVLQGKGLVLWGEAGTLVHDDTAVIGWEPELGMIVPARITGGGTEPNKLGVIENANGTIDLIEADANLEGFSGLPLQGVNITETASEGNGVSAYLRTGEFTTSPSYYAILHAQIQGLGSSLTNAHVYYFSFDPQRYTPAQLKALLLVLAQERLATLAGC